MIEREHHIKVLEQFLHDYQEWGEDLELEKTIKYAISSLKTDLKYDLMYEGEEIYTKTDMIGMLKEIQDKIFKESWRLECICDDLDGSAVDLDDINKIIQQKINKLRGDTK